MKTLLLASLFAACSFSQTVTTTPPAQPAAAVLGKVVATANTISCTLTGNALPATAIEIACVVNGVTIQPYTMPLAANSAYTFQHNFGPDAVTVILKVDADKAITADVAAQTAAGKAHTETPAKF